MHPCFQSITKICNHVHPTNVYFCNIMFDFLTNLRFYTGARHVVGVGLAIAQGVLGQGNTGILWDFNL